MAAAKRCGNGVWTNEQCALRLNPSSGCLATSHPSRHRPQPPASSPQPSSPPEQVPALLCSLGGLVPIIPCPDHHAQYIASEQPPSYNTGRLVGGKCSKVAGGAHPVVARRDGRRRSSRSRRGRRHSPAAYRRARHRVNGTIKHATAASGAPRRGDAKGCGSQRIRGEDEW